MQHEIKEGIAFGMVQNVSVNSSRNPIDFDDDKNERDQTENRKKREIDTHTHTSNLIQRIDWRRQVP